MTEIDLIIDELQRGYDGDPWHGSPTRQILEGTTAKMASARVIPDAHTIWELVLHMTAWKREVTRRLRAPARELTGESDWPTVPTSDERAWAGALASLHEAQLEIVAALRSFPHERLHERVGAERDRPAGTGVSYYVMLHGLAQHDAYHSGQIALLKKRLVASQQAG